MKILILGATGLLGQHLFVGLEDHYKEVFGTIRKLKHKNYFPSCRQKNLIHVENIFNDDELENILRFYKIDTVINCISLSNINMQPKEVIYSVFADFPKKLQKICLKKEIRIVQISSDGVFSGLKGNYTEDDIPDPLDTYGEAKLAGELTGPNQITLRLSMIGHDLINKNGLLEWFLLQKKCSLYSKYVFSGLTTNELTKIIRDCILDNSSLCGLYNVSANPISKYDLLKLVAKKYNLKNIFIEDDSVKINRTLLSSKFYKDTGYKPPAWSKLVDNMKCGEY
jgi:dTDP-4-dehydrorhamnose reductase